MILRRLVLKTLSSNEKEDVNLSKIQNLKNFINQNYCVVLVTNKKKAAICFMYDTR